MTIADCVRRTSIDLKVGDEPLAVRSARIVDSELPEPQQRHAHTENLPGAHMPMGHLGFHKKFVKGFHCLFRCTG